MDVVLAAGGAAWEGAAVHEIEGSSRLSLVRRCVDVADLLAVTSTLGSGVVLVSPELLGLDADVVHRIQSAGVRVLSVGSEATARHLGIDAYVAIGSLEDIARDYARPVVDDQQGRRAPMIAVWGPTGAPGRSTVALAVASAAAAQKLDTVLIDADTYGGSLGQMVASLDDLSGLMAACRAANLGRADQSSDHLLLIEDSLRLLTGIQRPDMWSHVRSGALSLVLAELRRVSDLVVVDCGFGIEPPQRGGASRDDATRLVLEDADAIVVVGRADPVGLARLVRAVHDLHEVVPSATPHVVLNMVRSSLGWQEREIVATVSRLTGAGHPTCLPYDRSGLDLALLTGRTPRVATPSSSFVSSVEALGVSLIAALGHASDMAPANA